MLPSQIFIIPQYQMLAKMGLTNSIFALVFPGLVSAFGTFFLRQAYMGIPDELGEAAYLDGCTKWQKMCIRDRPQLKRNSLIDMLPEEAAKELGRLKE